MPQKPPGIPITQAARMPTFGRFYLQEPVVNSGNLSPTYQPSSRRGPSGGRCGKKPRQRQAVWKREAPAIRGLFFVGSDETGPKTRCANLIDCSQDVVGEYAEGGFGCHSFDSSKWVLGSASPPPHEARIGLDARIHAL